MRAYSMTSNLALLFMSMFCALGISQIKQGCEDKLADRGKKSREHYRNNITVKKPE